MQQYLQNKVLASSKSKSELGILKDRLKSGVSLIYVCKQGNCQLPVQKLSDALGQIQ